MHPRRRWLLAMSSLLGALSVARAQPSAAHLPMPDDLRPLLAEVARSRAPLLLLFSTPGCPFCREVRQNYLMPRLAEERLRDTPRLILLEIDITARAPLIDGDGRATTQADFAARYDVRVVPVVVLFDERLRRLADPLVGIDRAGFYEGFLARAVDEAQRKMQR
jgi:thioredoxin-related protein